MAPVRTRVSLSSQPPTLSLSASSSSVESKLPPHVGAALLAQGVTYKQYGHFAALQPRLPSLWQARVSLKALKVRSVVVPGRMFASVDLKAIITRDLLANPRLREQLHHRIKIGGDASCDRSEKERKSRSILMMCMTYLDGTAAGLSPNSLHSHRVLCASWQKESHDTVAAQCQYVSEQFAALVRDGITLPHEPDRKYTFSVAGSGDWKWQRMAWGKQGGGSAFPCCWCNCRRSNFYRAICDAGGKLGSMYDHPLDAMPTV